MPSEESQTIRQQIHKETGENEAPLEDQRKAWIDYALTQAVDPRVALAEETIAGVPCLWITRTEKPSSTTILYIHGSGLVDGAIVTHREFVSRLVAETGHKALMVEYRLAPENKFPASLEDVLSVLEALPDGPFVVGGDSSGAGLAIAATAAHRDCKKRLPSCVFTISGVFDMTLSSKSMKTRNELDPSLSYEALKNWTKQYFADFDLSDERISPLHGSFEGFPPVLLQVGDHEVWLDDSLRLKEKIDAADGVADLNVWDSMWHVWHMYSDLPEAHQAINEIGDFIDRCLKNEAYSFPRFAPR